MIASPHPPVILVVEDDLIVRMSVVDAAIDAGLEILEASDADQAIALMEGHPDIVVLFTDVQMPGSMDGIALAHTVRTRWPPVKIIVASGRQGVTKDDLPENALFVPKPYLAAQIVDTLHRLAA